MGNLYLIPSVLSPETENQVLPLYVKEIIQNNTVFFVENIRTARRFISSLKLGIDISSLEFYVLDKDTSPEEAKIYLHLLLEGKDAGIISEAGCPGVADPGTLLISLAHQAGIKVMPLVGPSSILLALMASGFNGQSFSFLGYLPIDASQRSKSIREMEKISFSNRQTQIFMETPYRNNQLISDLIKECKPQTRLCIAANLTAKDEFIQSKTISLWNKQIPDIHKKPAIFLLQAS